MVLPWAPQQFHCASHHLALPASGAVRLCTFGLNENGKPTSMGVSTGSRSGGSHGVNGSNGSDGSSGSNGSGPLRERQRHVALEPHESFACLEFGRGVWPSRRRRSQLTAVGVLLDSALR